MLFGLEMKDIVIGTTATVALGGTIFNTVSNHKMKKRVEKDEEVLNYLTSIHQVPQPAPVQQQVYQQSPQVAQPAPVQQQVYQQSPQVAQPAPQQPQQVMQQPTVPVQPTVQAQPQQQIFQNPMMQGYTEFQSAVTAAIKAAVDEIDLDNQQ